MNDLASGAMLAYEDGTCHIDLSIDDPLIVPELLAHAPGAERDKFALTALRIGVLALKQAQGRLDADVIRGESDRLLATLEDRLASHQKGVQEHVGVTLREYFDPKNGRFNERVEQLVKSGGELERVLRAQIGASDSELARTLATHVGEQSTLMKILRPSETEGILASLTAAVQKALETQRNAILTEFSLDKPDSALSRLVVQVETAGKRISSEFSLDEQSSALARMKKALEELIEKSNRDNDEFRTQVREALAALQSRREEAQKSTRHGLEFEQAVADVIAADARGAGDILQRTGASTGLIKNCKTGDAVLTLGPEHAAAGAKIVFEAKQHASYNLAQALEEIEQARKNRDACVGVFVFSRRTLNADIAPLARYGSDIVVVWDCEDPSTDVILRAALSLARALCARAEAGRREDVDVERLQKAMLDIEKQIQGIDEIRKNAQSIRKCADTIEDRVRIVTDNLGRSTRVLDEEIAALADAG